MLYLFSGTDIATSAEKAHKLIDSLCAKKPDALLVRIEADNWSKSIISEHLGGQGLFSNKYIVFLDRLTENADAKENLADFIPTMHESENIFIVLEGKLNAELTRAFAKDTDKAVVSEAKMERSKDGNIGSFNIFALADAFAKRDALRSWNIYRQAIDSGTEPENIAGVLFWKMKTIYTNPEVRDLSEKLITSYHDAHRGMVNLELELEKMLLSL